MIEFEDVSFGYLQGVEVLDKISLEVPSGLTLAVGPNGCGKSTLLKMAAGVEMPRTGRVRIFGHDLWQEEVAARQNLAYLPEHPDLSPFATVREILQMVCGLREQPIEAAQAALEWTGMSDFGSRTVRELSLGQRRRAVLAAAQIGDPTCFLLDEPLEAMDRSFRSNIIDWIIEKRELGATILVVSHEIDSFAPIADRAVTIRHGHARRVDNLGETPAQRRLTLDQLARGLDP